MQTLLTQLERITPGAYTPGGPLAAEPTAWAAIALAATGRNDAADRACKWLVEQQAGNGSVPVTARGKSPNWTTSLAILAWHQTDSNRFEKQIDRATRWLLATKGKTNPRSEHIGHNTMLAGWSWAADTHSWLEPTAFATMALATVGQANHSRTQEAIAILVDRLLPEGGCNYGNTEVLGQTLLPHLQPSGIVLLALAGHGVTDPRVSVSLDYLEQHVQQPTGCTSLSFALLALAAWNRRPKNADDLIAAALQRPATSNSTHKLALLALASLNDHTLVHDNRIPVKDTAF